MKNSVFIASFFDKKKTIESLMEESKDSHHFFVLLIGSAVLATLGFLIDSTVVLIGAMLVAPLLLPILSLGMGVVTSSTSAINRSLKIIGKSIIAVVATSLLIAFLFGDRQVHDILLLSSQTTLIHFFVAFVSGIVASYAWAKSDVNSSLVGVAVSVSLIPPLSAVGIGISLGAGSVISGASAMFITNLIGITLAGVIVFSLFGFATLQSVQEKKVEEEVEEDLQDNSENLNNQIDHE